MPRAPRSTEPLHQICTTDKILNLNVGKILLWTNMEEILRSKTYWALRRVTDFKGVWFSLKWAKCPSQCNACWYGWYSCFYNRCSICFSCMSTQLSALRLTEVCVIFKKFLLPRVSPNNHFILEAVIPLSHRSALNTPKSSDIPTAKNPED